MVRLFVFYICLCSFCVIKIIKMAFLVNFNLLMNVGNQAEGNRGRRRQFTRERYFCRRLRAEVAFNDEMFKQNFRLSRNSFEVLINELGPHLKQGQTPYAVSTEKKVYIRN